MTQVIKVSKQGVNVGTATDPNDFIFDSELNTFKIIATGTALGTIAQNTLGTISTAHGQSYIPTVNGFALKQGHSGNLVGTGGSVIFLRGSYGFKSLSADGTNIHFEIINGIAQGTFTVRYYIFETPLV